MMMNQKGIVLSGLVYALLVFFLLLVVSLLTVLWYRQNAITNLGKDANKIYDNADNTPPTITLLGNSLVVLMAGDVYNDAGATAYDAENGDITWKIAITSNVNINVVGTYMITYTVSDAEGIYANPVTRTVDVKTSYYAGPDYIPTKDANGPVLAPGMTPIKWVGTAWANTTESDKNWYSYATTDKQWANAKTADGSMWVWIPRYVYRISSGWHSNTTGTIDIQFSMGTDDTRGGTVTLDSGTNSSASNNKWTNHPAFNFGGTELTGIWVAKFEASGTPNAINFVPNAVATGSTFDGNISDQFTAARNLETNSRYGWGTSGTDIDTHMIKNTEWGVVTYLSQSIYGKNAEIWINPSNNDTTGCAGDSVSSAATTGCLRAYDTVNGMKASTTGNIYGIYDMSGGASEYVAAYINNANAITYGGAIVSANAKYKDVYTVTTDNVATNYSNAINKKGDALYEVSSSGSGANTWNGDTFYMPETITPWLLRGGYGGYGAESGIYYLGGYHGLVSSAYGYRAVLLVGAGL